ncbi:MAG: L,D-transpeptidase family protein [Xanthobacteraceae bacterium]
MNRRSLVRPLLASAAIAVAIALAGCDTDGPGPTLRSLQPLSPQMVAEIEKRNMAKESPILIRIFKEESELEIWKEDNTGRMALLKTYPICRWSGELGPKLKEGDRQAPEGFYKITPSLMNPNSQYYLAINMGYPNAYDRSNKRTGAFLMIHGDCSSRGCYAMTDEQVAEIYALARESFFGGQGSFQIQAYPFRMTPQNLARHRNSPHIKFWRMLKDGYDHFEVTRQEPKIDVCERRYVFNAESSRRFTPAGRCPEMQVPEDVVAAVKDKQRRDNTQIAELVRRGTPASAVRTYADGGMHPTFRQAVQPYNVDDDGVVRTRVASPAGTIPANIRLPGAKSARAQVATGSLSEPEVAVETPSTTRVASADAKSGGGSSSLFGNLFSSSGGGQSSGVIGRMSAMMGLGGSQPAAKTPTPKARPAPSKRAAVQPRKKPETKQQTAKTNAGAIRPKTEAAAQKQEQQEQKASPPQTRSAGVLSGAQPVVPSGSFDNRFGAWR